MLEIVGDQIRYKLSWIENVGAFGRDPRANVASLKTVTFHQHPWSREVLRGIRAPGIGFPYLIMLGTMRYWRGRDFCAVYRRRPVFVLEFEGEKFARWVIPATKENRTLLLEHSISISNAN
jgi:hypothetical protein